jgi:hypothetical protein
MNRSGIKGDPWHMCDKCGDQFRTSQLRMQNGWWRCNRCIDATIIDRDLFISRVLNATLIEPRTFYDLKEGELGNPNNNPNNFG